ncbi:hypothetical protein HY797_00880 [Candidatus Falkowbacteria bacterium]|nr:hypothetical protein [Candidatus Falkowbacteria bacterium]
MKIILNKKFGQYIIMLTLIVTLPYLYINAFKYVTENHLRYILYYLLFLLLVSPIILLLYFIIINILQIRLYLHSWMLKKIANKYDLNFYRNYKIPNFYLIHNNKINNITGEINHHKIEIYEIVYTVADLTFPTAYFVKDNDKIMLSTWPIGTRFISSKNIEKWIQSIKMGTTFNFSKARSRMSWIIYTIISFLLGLLILYKFN